MAPTARWLASVLALALAPGATGEPLEGPQVSGQVLDPTGAPVAGAEVRLAPLANVCSAGPPGRTHAPEEADPRARTDRRGRFSLAAPEPGLWELIVEASGWASLERRLVPLLHGLDVGRITLAPAGEGGGGAREAEPAPPASAGAGDPGPAPPSGGPTRRLSGRVVDALSDAPVAGAWVWVADRPECHARASAAGEFVLAVEPASAGELAAAAAGYRVATVRLGPAGPSAQAAVVIALRPGDGVLVGVVVDSRGRPLPGAVVEVEDGPESALTDEAGRFRIAGVTVGDYLHLRVEREGFGALRTALRATQAGAEAAGGKALVLHRLRSALGVVTDAEGRRLPGVRVSAERAEPPAVETATDDSGRFELGPLGHGRVALTFEHQGFAAAVREVDVAEGEGPLDLGRVALAPGAVLRGTVTDESGEPVAEAAVYLNPSPRLRRVDDSGRPALPVAARTDAEGAFVVEDLEPGRRLAIEVWKPGHLPVQTSLVLEEPEEEIEVRLEPAVEVTVKVVDAGGVPVVHAAARLDSARLGGFPEEEGENWIRPEPVGPGVFSFDFVTPGEASLEVVAAGFARHREKLPIPSTDERLSWTVTLAPEAVVWGKVTDPDGRPVAGARVRVPAEITGHLLLPFDVADDAGRFRIESLRPGPMVMEASHLGFRSRRQEITVEPGEQRVDFVLQQVDGYEVSGVLLDEDRTPVPNATLRFVLAGAGAGSHAARTGTDGSFVATGLPSGRYTLFLEGRERVLDLASRRLEVEQADVRNLVLSASSGCAVEGTVEGLDPAELATVHLWARGPGGLQSGRVDPATGRFRLSGALPAGQWTLEASVGNSASRVGAYLECRDGVDLLDVVVALAGGG